MGQYSLETGYRKKRHWPKMIAAYVVILVVSTLVGCYLWYKAQLRPVGDNQYTQSFIVNTGDTSSTVALKLKQQGLIRNDFAFKMFLRLNNYSKLLPGEYQVSSSYDARRLADSIFNTEPSTEKITLLPGKTIDEYKKVFTEAGYAQDQVDQAFDRQTYSSNILKDKPASASLEGYIKPQTYTKLNKAEQTVEQLLSANLEERSDEVTEGAELKLSQKGLSLYQAITLASIVQQESADVDTQKQIAQVFLLRLEQGIPLGADPTFKYAAKITGQPSSPNIDSPYNTRVHAGLPPGPIGSFNDSALEAVIDPAEGDYLFFVAGDDGNTYFSRTDAEHQLLREQYCHELCAIY